MQQMGFWLATCQKKLLLGNQNKNWLRAFLSATLFLFFPFNYQVVPWIGAVSHLLVIAILLLSLVAYLQFCHTKQPFWFLLTLLCIFLAPFAHENGIVALPLLLILEILHFKGGLRSKINLVVGLIPLGLWFVVWQGVPKLGITQLLPFGVENGLQNLAYFSQGLAYPIAWIGQVGRNQLGINDMVAVVASTFICLLILAWFYVMQTNNLRRQLFPWVWVIGTSLPAILLLKFAYIISGARLLILPGVGIVWIWADLLTHLLLKKDGLLRKGTVVLLIILLLQNYQFIQQRGMLYKMLSNSWNTAVRQTEIAAAQQKTAVFINLPKDMTWPVSSYPIGHEGVVFLPDYIHEIKAITGQQTKPIEPILMRFDDVLTKTPYFYSVLGKGQNWREIVTGHDELEIFTTQFSSNNTELIYTGSISQYESSTPRVTFQESGTDLPIYLSEAKAYEANEQIVVELQWAIDKQIPPFEVVAFVHLLNQNGEIIGQADGYAWQGTFSMGLWPPNSKVDDFRYIQRVGGETAVRVGLYNFQTGERLRLLNSAVEQDAYIIPIDLDE